MSGALRLVRNVGVYFLFLLACVVASALSRLLFLLGDYLAHGRLSPLADVGINLFGAYIGVRMGVYMLNEHFRPYPARAYALTFTVPHLLLFLLTVGRVASEGIDREFLTDTPTLLMGAGTAWFLLWIKRGEVD